MDVSTISVSSMNWKELDDTRREIKHFLKSVDQKRIGTGLVYYDKEKFILLPRSEYSSNRTFQWAVSLINETATFGSTQEAWVTLKRKLEELYNKILTFKPVSKQNCPPEASTFFIKILEIQSLIKNVAAFGLNRLCLNYKAKSEIQHASSLEKLGKDSFKLIDDINELLKTALLSHLPDLQTDIQLHESQMAASKLLSKRQPYLTHLRGIQWTLEKGVVIPHLLIQDSLKDLKKTNKLNKEGIRNAANLIRLPSQALAISIQDGVEWIPLRPTGQEEIKIEKGITGSCERTGLNSSDLCNLFYRFDKSGLLTFTCGAIDTSIKMKQLVASIQLISSAEKEEKTVISPRWILHQLNSFYSEKDLIYKVHQQIPFIAEELKEATHCFLHINTSFNAASSLANEDQESFQNINIENLASLLQFAIGDMQTLLTQIKVSKGMSADLFTKVIKCAEEIREIKNKVAHSLDKKNLNQSAMSTTQQLRSSSVSSVAKENEDDKDPEEDESLSASFVENSKQLKTNLAEKRNELIKDLQTVTTEIQALLASLKADRPGHFQPNFEKSILILEVLTFILNLQCKNAKALTGHTLSRCSEIELFLLLYRLLNFNVVISCFSGLDRTGAVAAFQDSMIYLEENIFQNHLAELKKKLPENKTLEEFDLFVARVKAQHDLFEMIISLNHNRQELFEAANAFIKKNKIPVIQNNSLPTSESETSEQSTNLRAMLIQKFAQQDKKQVLVNTQYYLELVAKHLLGMQSEKTFYSTGVIGLKYHHDAGWFKKTFAANPHPLERLPMFILDDKNNVIELFKYSKGWSYTSTTINPIAISLIMRLSQLRGT